MDFFLGRPEYKYELENICRLFFPSEKINPAPKPESSELCASVEFSECEGQTVITCKATAFSKKSEKKAVLPIVSDAYEKRLELAAARALYSAFSELCDFSPAWGILTGVRPAKLFCSFAEDVGTDEACSIFKNEYLVDGKKIELCKASADAEKKAKSQSFGNSFSLYVSIPFCPSRCHYCSFVSHSVANAGKLVPKYVELLTEEIKKTAEVAKKIGLRLSTVYFGGGTPTQLSAAQLEVILSQIEQSFDLSQVAEYTVEAGRPDTVTKEKLDTLKRHGVGRISINPQTLDDRVLQNIGRKHTVDDFYKAYDIAKSVGFDTINTDLIAGLSGDTAEGFLKSVEGIIDLSPENITVHTLAMKRSSSYVENGAAVYSAESKTASEMVEKSTLLLQNAGFSPYYLYRQSKCLGNLENVGWSREGHDCHYNIYMMNELHTVLAVGAGAVSRLKAPSGNHIERIFNFKYPYEYINRFEEILKRKDTAGDFYEKFPF